MIGKLLVGGGRQAPESGNPFEALARGRLVWDARMVGRLRLEAFDRRPERRRTTADRKRGYSDSPEPARGQIADSTIW